MSKRLLVIDDATIIREMIKDAASAAGFEIVGEANNGQLGIEQYQALRPDVVTLDMVMPEFDGLHALKGIREFDSNAQVLVVSAVEQTKLLKEAFKLGAADFIVKPFDPENLVATLEKLAGAVEV